MSTTTLNTEQRSSLQARIATAEKTLLPFFASLRAVNDNAAQDDFTPITPADKEREALAHKLTHSVYFSRFGFADSGGRHYLWSGCVSEAKAELQRDLHTVFNTVATLEEIARHAEEIINKPA